MCLSVCVCVCVDFFYLFIYFIIIMLSEKPKKEKKRVNPQTRLGSRCQRTLYAALRVNSHSCQTQTHTHTHTRREGEKEVRGRKLYLHERMAKTDGLHGLQKSCCLHRRKRLSHTLFFFHPCTRVLLDTHSSFFFFCAHSYALEHLNTSPRVGVCFLAQCVCACRIESMRERDSGRMYLRLSVRG